MKAITVALDEEDYSLIRYALNELASRRMEQSIESPHRESAAACRLEAAKIHQLNDQLHDCFRKAQL